MPHHAALEYQRNRLGVIADQKGRFSQVIDLLEDTESRILSALAGFQLKNDIAQLSPMLSSQEEKRGVKPTLLTMAGRQAACREDETKQICRNVWWEFGV